MHKNRIFYVFLISMFLSSILMINKSSAQATKVKVVAPTTDIQAGTIFNVDITVVDVTDLYAWQIKLYYNNETLRWRDATYPPGHVFDGRTFVPVTPYNDTDTEGTYMSFFASLQGDVLGFTGSGVLCRISFEARAAGTSTLVFSSPLGEDTWLWDHTLADISFSVVESSVNVVGTPPSKQPSSISINANPSTVEVGSNVTITGTIDPSRVGVNVMIRYRTLGGAWFPSPLATVQTNGLSRYEYNWTTSNIGQFELYASWQGDTEYNEASSNITTVTVNIRTSIISLNVQPTNATTGSTFTITGAITPAPAAPPYVTIYHRKTGGNWTAFEPILASSTGTYQTTWKVNEAGTYELKASWPGDSITLNASSDVKTIETTGELPPPPPDIMTYAPYIVGAIVIIAIVAIGVYFTKIKKR